MSSSPTNTSRADRELADEIVQRWGDNLKKALLGYSVLRVLADGPAWSKEIFAAVSEQTNWQVSERGFYRLLRTMDHNGLIAHTKTKSPEGGTDRKNYAITATGTMVYADFSQQLTWLSRR